MELDLWAEPVACMGTFLTLCSLIGSGDNRGLWTHCARRVCVSRTGSFLSLRKKKVWCAYTDNLLLVRDQVMANVHFVCRASISLYSQPPLPCKSNSLAHHHVTKIVHSGNKAEDMAVNEVDALALLSFLPHLRYV